MIGFMLIFVSISNMSTAEGFNKECDVILRLQHNFLSNIIFEDIDFRVSVYIEQVEPAMGILFFFFHVDMATSGLRASVCTCGKPNLAWQNYVGDVKPCNDWPQAEKLIAEKEKCLL